MSTTDRDGQAEVPTRSPLRRAAASVIIGVAAFQALGLSLKMPSQFGANDISRWCTVWSLLERGTYAIDDCPWQGNTQDKVLRPDKLTPPGSLSAKKSTPLKRIEYALAPAGWKIGPSTKRLYSSKPPLLPTLLAGILYPARKLSGVELGYKATQPRNPRWVEKESETKPGTFEHVYETPKKPIDWPAYVFYLKPSLVLFNVVPYLAFLILYARLVDRYAPDDWTWFVALASAAWGTMLLAFLSTLNNHTISAFSAFFALYQCLKIWDDPAAPGWRFAIAGFFAAFCACNELPAAPFGVIVFGLLLVRSPIRSLTWFAPAAALPCLAFLVTQFLAFGQFTPVYEEFGTESYEFAGSYWTTPLEMDWYNKQPEPKSVYLFHMTLGHHGVFSLTPIYLVSMLGMLRLLGRGGGLRWVAWMTLALTVGMLAFYTWNPKARNYGGSTQGLRWLFWLIPFWLIVLPEGLSVLARRAWSRRVGVALLGLSAFSVAYALRVPWSHPWIVDLMEHLNLLTLPR